MFPIISILLNKVNIARICSKKYFRCEINIQNKGCPRVHVKRQPQEMFYKKGKHMENTSVGVFYW